MDSTFNSLRIILENIKFCFNNVRGLSAGRNKMAIWRAFYNALFRRTSTFTLTILVGGIVFERAYDSWVDSVWEKMNKGVRLRVVACICIDQ